ncbi:aminoglycoside phosphotransferase family protein [Numidum massiliense]|uniref:aminoglycoside phosphotransferase family protein n=1 Tax=Numidum massiliense TaxID=1522315 RepID=UPI0006D53E56|nr:aminoglycoside phosphotransferase family protein [Numidum massiliense]
MQLHEDFKTQIKRAFGERGRRWLDHLPHLLHACQQKWQLRNSHPAPRLSYNFVCFAESPAFGEVVLKIGVPHSELYTEMRALSFFDGRRMCKLYDTSEALGALLIERIRPGTDLTALASNSERIAIAAEVISTLYVPSPTDCVLPTYGEWLEGAFQRAREENVVGEQMLHFIATAERLFQEIAAPHRPQVLLHGDLHHYNILQDEGGSWKAIDPKGVVGVPCLEPARFMENQLDMVSAADKANCLQEMIAVFSHKFGESQRTMASCLFVDAVLSTCWHFEDRTDGARGGEGVGDKSLDAPTEREEHEEREEREKLNAAIDQCALILDFLQSC